MKTILVIASLVLAMSNVFAADKKAPSPAQQAQQERMKACNAEAGTKELKGDERKKFMSECLSAKAAATPTQQSKMKACNADAGSKALKGDERNKFISDCLKGDKA